MFSLISILYSVFNEHFLNLIFIKFCKHLILLKCLQNSRKLVGLSGLEPPTSCLSGMRSNHLSYNPLSWRVRFLFFGSTFVVVEMMGFEPMTPCLQGRCSPNWATPPYSGLFPTFLQKDPSKLNNEPKDFRLKSLWLMTSCVCHSRFSIERRWSSRTFRYGYLVTT